MDGVGIGCYGQGGTRMPSFAVLQVSVLGPQMEGAVKADPSLHWKCQVMDLSNIHILSVFLAFLIFDPATESAGVQKSTHTDPMSKSWP